MKRFSATKEIGIDAAHRVPDHASKCRSVHGHRYTIQATIEGNLHEEGPETGMVMDFGFLKELMMENIDTPCDHGLIVWSCDDKLLKIVIPGDLCREAIISNVQKFGSWEIKNEGGPFRKIYVMGSSPTAENLAQHWYQRLEERVDIRSKGHATLRSVRVWETPSSFADYPIY